MKPMLTCRNLGTMLTNGGSSLALLFSSDHTVYLTMAPASSAPSNFSSPLSLEQNGRSQIICRLVSHFKVKQQLSSQLSPSAISRPCARELEIEQNFRMDQGFTSLPIYCDDNFPDHLSHMSACNRCEHKLQVQDRLSPAVTLF